MRRAFSKSSTLVPEASITSIQRMIHEEVIIAASAGTDLIRAHRVSWMTPKYSAQWWEKVTARTQPVSGAGTRGWHHSCMRFHRAVEQQSVPDVGLRTTAGANV
jgi:hypothetical protein